MVNSSISEHSVPPPSRGEPTSPKRRNSAANGPLIIEGEQGTDAWFEHRLGHPTASGFKYVLAKGEGKSRNEYMRKIAGEKLTAERMESFSNSYTDRGTEQEPEAIETYEFLTDNAVRRVALVVHREGIASCSPDGLIGDNGGLECKSQSPHLMIETIRLDRMPPEHKAQVQGALWVCEREWWDVFLFYRSMPVSPRFRVFRDDAYIAQLDAEVRRFNEEVEAMCEMVRRYGRR